jgi:hypothetical protein
VRLYPLGGRTWVNSRVLLFLSEAVESAKRPHTLHESKALKHGHCPQAHSDTESKINPQLATLLARQRSYTRSAEIISVPTDALSPRLTTLLARQHSYTHSAEIISVSTDALSPQLATLLARQNIYTRSAEIVSVPTDASSP